MPTALLPTAALLRANPPLPVIRSPNTCMVARAPDISSQRAVEPVIAAHEFRREQRRRLVVERGRRAVLRDHAGIEQHDRSAIAIASTWSWVTWIADRPSVTISVRSQARASSRSLASRLDSGSSSRITGGS